MYAGSRNKMRKVVTNDGNNCSSKVKVHEGECDDTASDTDDGDANETSDGSDYEMDDGSNCKIGAGGASEACDKGDYDSDMANKDCETGHECASEKGTAR